MKVLAGQIEGPEDLNAIDIFQDAGCHFTLGLLEIGADRPHRRRLQNAKGSARGITANSAKVIMPLNQERHTARQYKSG